MDEMKTRRVILSVLLSLVAFFLFVLIIRQSQERLLYHTLDNYQRIRTLGPSDQAPRPQLSRWAIPILLDWLDESEELASNQFRGRLLRICGLRVFESSDYLRTLGSLGFDVLGPAAAPALPRLRELAPEGENLGRPIMAMASIGEPAIPIALEFAQSSDSGLRRDGAFLLGCLRTQPERSVPALLKLLDDTDRNVRHEACTALAEFPSPETEKILFSRLVNASTIGPAQRNAVVDQQSDLAYALYLASPDTLVRLIDFSAESTNIFVRHAVLSAFLLRDEAPALKRPGPLRHEVYRSIRWNFDGPKTLYRLDAVRQNDPLFELVRSNVLSSGEPKLKETLLRLGRIR
jgi:hypothetical protein